MQRKKSYWKLLCMLCMLCCVFFVTEKYTVHSVSAATATKKIEVLNEKGKYLKKIDGSWYYYDKKGKPMTDIHYIKIPGGQEIGSGYYMFEADGRMVRKRVMYYLKKRVIDGVTFQGYYMTSVEGRFSLTVKGLRYFSTVYYNGTAKKKTLNNFYYVGKYGKLSTAAQLRYIPETTTGGKTFTEGYYMFDNKGCLITGKGVRWMKAAKVNGVEFKEGYYYFASNGRMSRTKCFRKLKQTVDGVKFNGYYYFGDTNARLYQKSGWVTFKNKKYYLNSKGKRYENCWKGGYYLLEDGTIAVSMRVPDGSYVDHNGRKCAKNEMALSSLKSQINQTISKYSGTWSVYVKNLKTGDIVLINDVSMYPASTIKAFAMASMYDQINKGKVSYTSSIKSNLWYMITESDNEAYNQIVMQHTSSRNFASGAYLVNQYLKANGYLNTECHTTLSPSYTGYRSDGLGSNKASAKDCGVLLEKIYKGTCVSKKYSKEMLNLLKNQKRTWKIPYALPAGVTTANKTGETSTTQHDMAIVYGAKTDYVLCVFSSNVSEYYGIRGIREISSQVYNYLN